MQFIWLPDLLSSFLWLYLLNGRTVISQLLLKSGKISDSLRLKSIIYLTYRIFHFHSFGLLFLPYLLYWILWSCYVFTSLSPSAVCALLEVMQELICVFGISEHSYNHPLDELHVWGSTKSLFGKAVTVGLDIFRGILSPQTSHFFCICLGILCLWFWFFGWFFFQLL